MPRLLPILLLLACAACARPDAPTQPRGLGRAALANDAFRWTTLERRGLRVHFAADTYAAAHADSLADLTAYGRERDLALLGLEDFGETIDVFFIDSREQMNALTGAPVTGFAHRDSASIFVVTNPEWRGFQTHELMHVIAHQAWGAAAQPSGWIEEGLAQLADARCAGYPVDSVAHAMASASGAVPFDTLVPRFRQLDDLTAYLQAASMVGFLHDQHGRDAVREVWQRGTTALPASLRGEAFVEAWRRWAAARATPIPPDHLERIREDGCGIRVT